MKAALITGITGQDGSFLAEHLLKEGTLVIGLMRRSSRQDLGSLSHPSFKSLDSIKLVEGDITDPFGMERVMRDILHASHVSELEIYHLAAQSHVGHSHEIPIQTIYNNGIGTVVVLETAKKLQEETQKPVKTYFAATSECFSGHLDTVPQSESTPMDPQSPYAMSKVLGVHYSRYARNRGQFASVGFLNNHESERRGLDFVTRKITYNMAKIRLGLGEKFGLGNLQASRDWGSAKDFTKGMIQIIRHSEPDEFVLATGETRTVREFVQAAMLALDLPGEVEDYVYVNPRFFRPVEVDILCGDRTKAEEVLGWKPETSFEEMVEEMVEWDLKILQDIQ